MINNWNKAYNFECTLRVCISGDFCDWKLDVMYLKMYIKSERFYQQPDQALKEERYFSDYDEELDDRK